MSIALGFFLFPQTVFSLSFFLHPFFSICEFMFTAFSISIFFFSLFGCSNLICLFLLLGLGKRFLVFFSSFFSSFFSFSFLFSFYCFANVTDPTSFLSDSYLMGS